MSDQLLEPSSPLTETTARPCPAWVQAGYLRVFLSGGLLFLLSEFVADHLALSPWILSVTFVSLIGLLTFEIFLFWQRLRTVETARVAFKTFSLVALFISGITASIMASQWIHEIIHYDPSSVPKSLALLSGLGLLVFWTYAIAVMFGASSLLFFLAGVGTHLGLQLKNAVHLVLLTFFPKPSIRRMNLGAESAMTWIGRGLAAGTASYLLSLCATWLRELPSRERSLLVEIVVKVDFYGDHQCSLVARDNTLVAYLPQNRVLVATRQLDTWEIHLETCLKTP